VTEQGVFPQTAFLANAAQGVAELLQRAHAAEAQLQL